MTGRRSRTGERGRASRRRLTRCRAEAGAVGRATGRGIFARIRPGAGLITTARCRSVTRDITCRVIHACRRCAACVNARTGRTTRAACLPITSLLSCAGHRSRTGDAAITRQLRGGACRCAQTGRQSGGAGRCAFASRSSRTGLVAGACRTQCAGLVTIAGHCSRTGCVSHASIRCVTGLERVTCGSAFAGQPSRSETRR